MKIDGFMTKEGRWYIVEMPLLDAITQGRTKKEALEMAKDWVESMVDKDGFSAEASLIAGEKYRFTVTVSDAGLLVALILRRRREAAGLSLSDVATRLGAVSKNTYARYERGSSVPSIVKFTELLHAVDPEHDVSLALC